MVQLPALALSCRMARGQIGQDRAGEIMSLVSLVASDADEDAERKPLDMVIVVDKSGSMSGEKMTLVKETLSFLIKCALTDRDRLGLVTFDSNVVTEFKLTNVTADNKITMLNAVHRITADSNTNLSGGIFEGVKMLLDCPDLAERSGVCVLTDGQANEGVKGEQLIAMLQTLLRKFTSRTAMETWTSSLSGLFTGIRSSFRGAPLATTEASSSTTTTTSSTGSTTAHKTPPAIFTFGFGSDAACDELTAIATVTGGNYYSILSTEAVPLAFTDALGGLLSVAAQNIEMRVTVTNATSVTPLTKLQFEQPTTTTATLKLKDMYSGEHRDVLFRMDYPPSTLPITIKVEVRYIDTISDVVDAKVEGSGTVVRVPPSQMDSTIKEEDDAEVLRHLVRWETIVALEEARHAADAGDLAGGQRTIEATMQRMASAMDTMHIKEEEDDMLAELGNDLRTAKNSLKSVSGYSNGRSKMAAAGFSHAQQRSNKTEEFLEHHSSVFMADVSDLDGQVQLVSSGYSNNAKKSLFARAKDQFNLS